MTKLAKLISISHEYCYIDKVAKPCVNLIIHICVANLGARMKNQLGETALKRRHPTCMTLEMRQEPMQILAMAMVPQPLMSYNENNFETFGSRSNIELATV